MTIRLICAWMLLLGLGATACKDERTFRERFDEAWAAVQVAEAKESWSDAVVAYRRVLELVPGDPVCELSLARALIRTGRSTEAWTPLHNAVEGGWDDPDGLRDDPVLKKLQSDARFDRLLERAREIAAQDVLVYVPADLPKEARAPLVIAFHGRGENPHIHVRMWRDAADRLGAVVALPRGPRKLGPRLSRAWEQPGAGGLRKGLDLVAIEPLLTAALAEAGRHARIDADRVVLAGYSQGGGAALALLAESPVPLRGALALRTTYSTIAAEKWARAAAARRLRVYLLPGELDRLAPDSAQAEEALKAATIEVRTILETGVGHEPSAQCTERFIDAVRWILATE